MWRLISAGIFVQLNEDFDVVQRFVLTGSILRNQFFLRAGAVKKIVRLLTSD